MTLSFLCSSGCRTHDNSHMKFSRMLSLGAFALLILSSAPALEKQPDAAYRARRVGLAAKLHGGVALLFAAEEAQLDFMPYRQDEDFYYLTGWNQPGAALLIVAQSENAPGPNSPAGSRSRARIAKCCFCPRGICAEKNTPGSKWTPPLQALRRAPASMPSSP